MSYVVLARKYRPRVFAELVGQAHVVQALSNALIQQRLHHAYLFTGTRGVGKTTISRILAKSLNCTGADGQGGITAEPCGVCAACRDIDAGRHVDYIELDAASNRGVDEISQLLDQSVYKPVVGRFKVYMIDEVHMLSSTAFNAMLKTLEEPPDYLKFVLATTDPQKVPVTVLSRCLQFNLRPMAPETVQEHLVHVLASEGIAAEPGALRLLARAARGSMRDALSLSDQAIAFGGGRLEEAAVRQMLGAVDRGHAVRIIEAVAAGEGAALMAQVDELRLQGLSAAGTLEELMRIAQEMAVAQAVPQALDAADPDAAQVARLAGLMAPDETQLLYSVALHGRAELALAPDEYSGLSMVLLRLLAFKPGEASGARAGRGPAAGAETGGARPVLSQPAATQPAATQPVASQPVASPPVASQPVGAKPSTAQAPTRADGLAASASAAAPAPASVAVPRSAGLSHAPAVARAVTPVPALREPAPGSTPPLQPREPAASRPAASTGAVMPSREPPPWEAGEASIEEDPAVASTGGPDDEPPPWVDEGPDDIGPVRDLPAGRGAGVQSEAAVSPAALPSIERDPATDRWLAWIEPHWRSGALTALARELAWQAQCVGGEAGAAGSPSRWVLRVARETLRQDAVRDRLQAALSQASGGAVRLQIEPGEVRDSAALRDALAKAQAQAAAEDEICNDPLVQALLSEFKTARIVPGSVRPA